MSQIISLLVWLREEQYCDWLFYAVPMSGTTKEKQKLKFSLYIDTERSWDSQVLHGVKSVI